MNRTDDYRWRLVIHTLMGQKLETQKPDPQTSFVSKQRETILR